MSAAAPYREKWVSRRYGDFLAFADDALAATWCGPSRLKQHLFRAYCKMFGYPELAGHRRYRLVCEALGSRVCTCVVDVGARNGFYALADALHRPQTSYYTVDIARSHLHRLGLAARQFGVLVHPIAARAEALSLPDGFADLVLTIEVLQFVQDDRKAVEEIGRILRHRGLWWCEQELDTKGKLNRRTRDPGLMKHRPGHSTKRLTELAESAGMRLVTSYPVDGLVGRWWEGLESRILRLSTGLHLLAFPALRALAALTGNRWMGTLPATVFYCFERQP